MFGTKQGLIIALLVLEGSGEVVFHVNVGSLSLKSIHWKCPNEPWGERVSVEDLLTTQREGEDPSFLISVEDFSLVVTKQMICFLVMHVIVFSWWITTDQHPPITDTELSDLWWSANYLLILIQTRILLFLKMHSVKTKFEKISINHKWCTLNRLKKAWHQRISICKSANFETPNMQ